MKWKVNKDAAANVNDLKRTTHYLQGQGRRKKLINIEMLNPDGSYFRPLDFNFFRIRSIWTLDFSTALDLVSPKFYRSDNTVLVLWGWPMVIQLWNFPFSNGWGSCSHNCIYITCSSSINNRIRRTIDFNWLL